MAENGKAHGKKVNGSCDEMENTDAVFVGSDNEEMETEENGTVYIPKPNTEESEALEFDRTAYVLLHEATTPYPCLSFDIIPDSYGEDRASIFPLTAHIVAGQTTANAANNALVVMRLYNIKKTQKEESDASDSDEDDDQRANNEAKIKAAYIPHFGGSNRVRVARTVNSGKLVASWSDRGNVYVYNMSEALAAIESDDAFRNYKKRSAQQKPLYTLNGNQEGFALDWSPVKTGALASGDCDRRLFIWTPENECSSWKVGKPLVGHTDSVEDIQWSPNEETVLASCSVDRTIRIWDIRGGPEKACQITVGGAHDGDVNVISWSRHEPFLLSGGDDGVIKAWDLRQIKESTPTAVFTHHKKPITSIEWHPKDSTVFLASSEDDQVTLWDLAVERDTEAEIESEDLSSLPPQLLFIHQGQKEIKECHWHPQMPGLVISTALSGFNIFRTISA